MGLKLGVAPSDFTGSRVPAETIAAYLAAEYRFWVENPFVLIIGQVNARLAALFDERGVSSAAVVTAWNPLGDVRSATDNHRAQAALIARLDTLGVPHLPGHGADPTGAWTPEDSRLALGIDQACAIALGREFRQNAIIWADRDAVPRLAMLR